MRGVWRGRTAGSPDDLNAYAASTVQRGTAHYSVHLRAAVNDVGQVQAYTQGVRIGPRREWHPGHQFSVRRFSLMLAEVIQTRSHRRIWCISAYGMTMACKKQCA